MIKNKLVTDVKSEVEANLDNLISNSGNLDVYHFENFREFISGNAKLKSL